MVLKADRVREVRDLLRRNSERTVARLTGVSRKTVTRIARGKHKAREPTYDMAPDPRPTGRCPGCGRKIELPCRACEAEAARGPRRGARIILRAIGPLGLNLQPSQRSRYLEVKRMHVEAIKEPAMVDADLPRPVPERGGRLAASRDLVEARLRLHRRTLGELLDRIARTTKEEPTAEAVAQAIGWLNADVERAIRELFELPRPLNPGRLPYRPVRAASDVEIGG
jgi:hypothetical protein